MSIKYDQYLNDHIKYVQEAYNWLKEKFPSEFEFENDIKNWSIKNHDESKWSKEEYDAYDKWFYKDQSFNSKKEFDRAWLHHIHNNPHHWQYWCLIEDGPQIIPDNDASKVYAYKVETPLDNYISTTKGNTIEDEIAAFVPNKVPVICVDMPDNYIMEMISDWWSFSWKSGDLYEIFNWYNNHKDTMKLSDKTRLKVETMLGNIKKALGKEVLNYIKKGRENKGQ